MPDTIEFYLNNKDKWQVISDNMAHLLSEELPLKNSVAQILERAEQSLVPTTTSAVV